MHDLKFNKSFLGNLLSGTISSLNPFAKKVKPDDGPPVDDDHLRLG
jgi:hypothetical protein